MRQFLATIIALSSLMVFANRNPVRAQLELPLLAPENQPADGARNPRSLLERPDADPDGWVPVRRSSVAPRSSPVSAPPPRQTLPLYETPRQPPPDENTVPQVYPSTGYPALFENMPAVRIPAGRPTGESPAARPPTSLAAPRPPASWNSSYRPPQGGPPSGANGRPPTYGSAPAHRPPPGYRPAPTRQPPPGTRSPTNSRSTPQTARPSSDPESPWDLLQRWNPFR